MIKLYVDANTPQAQKWKETLKEWCVAHQIVETVPSSIPEVKDGNRHIVGTEAIDQFLREYKIAMDEWYDCRCDKWLDA